jgi:15-cis-phytoene synthase
MTSDAALREAYTTCEIITRTQARNFHYGIRLLPRDKRAGMNAVYAFARRIDDIGDGDMAEQVKLDRLAAARKAVREAAASDSEPTDPVLLALRDTASLFPLPLLAFEELIDGVEMDVRGHRFETFDDLIRYCRCVAGSIGRLCLGVFGCEDIDAAMPLADALGIALQQTNILRDIREDLANGRVYLPAEDLDRFGVMLRLTADGEVGGPPGRLHDLVAFEAERAAGWYRTGLALLPMLDRRSAACCAAMSGIYRRLLDRIAEDPEAALTSRQSLGTWKKISVATRALAGMQV